MKNTTPSGTRTFEISNPFGRTVDSITSPIGSGSAATSSKAAAIPDSIRDGFSRKRSISRIAEAELRGRGDIV